METEVKCKWRGKGEAAVKQGKGGRRRGGKEGGQALPFPLNRLLQRCSQFLDPTSPADSSRDGGLHGNRLHGREAPLLRERGKTARKGRVNGR